MIDLKNRIREKEFKNKFSIELLKIEKIFNNIYKKCNYKFIHGCGSYLFDGKNYKYSIDNYPKQKLLYEISKNKKKILEIGTYMGHSLLIMLMANPRLNITCIDIDDKYSKPATDYLKTEYPNSNIEFIKINSLDFLSANKNKYDFFHIDGNHKNKIITKEFNYCLDLRMNNNMEIILDDIDNCLVLKKNILSSFKITKSILPKCIGRNFYIKIKLSKNKLIFYKERIILLIKNLISYILIKINKIVRLKKI